MDRQRKQSWIGTLCVVLSLLLAAAWWMYSPTALRAYRYHRDEIRLRQELRTIHLPPKTANFSVKVMHVTGDTELESMHRTDSDIETVNAFYRQEFARLGFTYQGVMENTSLFCAPRYRASFAWMPQSFSALDPKTSQSGTRIYLIYLSGNDGKC